MPTMNTLHIPSPLDLHVHLREGPISEVVTPHVKQGGVDVAYVMVSLLFPLPLVCFFSFANLDVFQPNLSPPITTTSRALAYQATLQSLAPDVEFLMTLYLHPSITPDEIRKAHAAGVRGVKSYPRGVTTNSDGGIEDYESYYQVFGAMEEVGMVLNLHGEVPSDHDRVSQLFPPFFFFGRNEEADG